MPIVTRPDSPNTSRAMSEGSLRSGMKSISLATPSSVSYRVSRISVPGRYFRLARNFSVGAIRHRPLSGVPSSAAKHASESNPGEQTHDPAGRRAAENIGNQRRHASAFDDDVRRKLDDVADRAGEIKSAEVADEAGLRPIGRAVEHIDLMVPLHTQHGGEKPDWTG